MSIARHLRREAVQSDGRISLISLTPSGRRYAAAVQKTFAAVAYEHFVAPLDEADLANMRRIWDKLCPTGAPCDRAGSANESTRRRATAHRDRVSAASSVRRCRGR